MVRLPSAICHLFHGARDTLVIEVGGETDVLRVKEAVEGARRYSGLPCHTVDMKFLVQMLCHVVQCRRKTWLLGKREAVELQCVLGTYRRQLAEERLGETKKIPACQLADSLTILRDEAQVGGRPFVYIVDDELAPCVLICRGDIPSSLRTYFPKNEMLLKPISVAISFMLRSDEVSIFFM